MKVIVNTVNFEAKQPLKDHLDSKLGKLEQFHDNIIKIEVFLKLENKSEKENKTAELTVHIPGDDLRVSKTETTFEGALDHSLDTMIRQVKKKKEKMIGR